MANFEFIKLGSCLVKVDKIWFALFGWANFLVWFGFSNKSALLEYSKSLQYTALLSLLVSLYTQIVVSGSLLRELVLKYLEITVGGLVLEPNLRKSGMYFVILDIVGSFSIFSSCRESLCATWGAISISM